ncbi:MAG: putative cysteine protease YraA [Cytophagaceae bacterium]|jgi:hypothetical protein|nr:putative cysteine protease YraA [Cytophagaceae bacterium]
MQLESNKVAILVSNYFKEFQFDDALKTLSNVGNIDIISSDSGKIKSWDKSEKEYHSIVLYKNEIQKINAMDYNTIIIHEDLVNTTSQYVNTDTVSFINKFMGRMKPIVAVCQNEWTIITGSRISKGFDVLTQSENPFKISA